MKFYFMTFLALTLFFPFMMPTDDDFALGRDDGNINMHLLCRLLSLLLKTHLKSTEASLKSNLLFNLQLLLLFADVLEALGDCFI